MSIYGSTQDRAHDDDEGNTLLSELLSYNVAYRTAKKKTTAEHPFMAFYNTADEIEMEFHGSAKQANDSTNALYIVAPDNPIQSFSLIARKEVPNSLGELPKDALRRALGTLLDKA